MGWAMESDLDELEASGALRPRRGCWACDPTRDRTEGPCSNECELVWERAERRAHVMRRTDILIRAIQQSVRLVRWGVRMGMKEDEKQVLVSRIRAWQQEIAELREML